MPYYASSSVDSGLETHSGNIIWERTDRNIEHFKMVFSFFLMIAKLRIPHQFRNWLLPTIIMDFGFVHRETSK